MRVASLDDDSDQLELTKYTLQAIGHDCNTFNSTKEFLRELARESYDLIVIDWNLPDGHGPDIVRWIRTHVKEKVPILFLTSRNDEASIVEGLACGADDFMNKPMRVGELTARVRALLRRAYDEDVRGLEWGTYRFRPADATVQVGEELVELKQREFDLALFLFRHQGRMLSRSHLLEAVWTASNPMGTELRSRSLDTHISRIRKLLHLTPANGFRLSSVYGQGYRLEAVNPQGDDIDPIG